MIAEPNNKFGRRRDETATAEELLLDLPEALERMPHSKEAEEGLLSCLLQNPDHIMEARARLQPPAFYHEETRTMYEELLTMDQEGLDLDPIVLNNRLGDQGKLGTRVGYGRVIEITTQIMIPSYFHRYLTMVLERWQLRRGIHGHLLAVQMLFRHLGDRQNLAVSSTLNDCQSLIQSALDGAEIHTGTSAPLRACLNEHVGHMQHLQEMKLAGQAVLIPTGFPTLDRRAGGIARNEYWLVTGPTKSGKSVLAGQIVKHAAAQGWKCKIYTNEIQRIAYAGRFLASESPHFDGSIERHGFETQGQMEHYARAVSTLKDTLGDSVILDNAAGKYVEDIVADMRVEARQGVALFVIDLIGKLKTRASHGNRERELAHISGCLSDATKVLDVACLVVAQENEEGAVRESRALGMDCEAWLKLAPVYAEKKRSMTLGRFQETLPDAPAEPMPHQRKLIVQLARSFASGDVIPCTFDGPRFTLTERVEKVRPTSR